MVTLDATSSDASSHEHHGASRTPASRTSTTAFDARLPSPASNQTQPAPSTSLVTSNNVQLSSLPATQTQSAPSRTNRSTVATCASNILNLQNLSIALATFVIAREAYEVGVWTYNLSIWTARKDFRDDCRSQIVCSSNSPCFRPLSNRSQQSNQSLAFPLVCRDALTGFLDPPPIKRSKPDESVQHQIRRVSRNMNYKVTVLQLASLRLLCRYVYPTVICSTESITAFWCLCRRNSRAKWTDKPYTIAVLCTLVWATLELLHCNGMSDLTGIWPGPAALADLPDKIRLCMPVDYAVSLPISLFLIGPVNGYVLCFLASRKIQDKKTLWKSTLVDFATDLESLRREDGVMKCVT